MVLAEALKEFGFDVEKEIYGRDLIVTLRGKNLKYSIEVKSTFRESFVCMTPFQDTTAVKEFDNYALCVVHKDDNLVTVDFIKNNAKFLVNIGTQLKNKVNEVGSFENNKSILINTIADIDLLIESDFVYKYKINNSLWTRGNSFANFIAFISTKK